MYSTVAYVLCSTQHLSFNYPFVTRALCEWFSTRLTQNSSMLTSLDQKGLVISADGALKDRSNTEGMGILLELTTMSPDHQTLMYVRILLVEL